MKKGLDKHRLVFLIYLTLVLVGYVFFYLHVGTSEFQKSFSFIRIHAFVILLLLWVRSKLDTSDAAILLWGIIVYESELILYNILLVIVTKKNYEALNTSYDVVMCLSFTILVAVLFCQYFNKIILLITKIISYLKRYRNE
jgi:hypothetical protein